MVLILLGVFDVTIDKTAVTYVGTMGLSKPSLLQDMLTRPSDTN